MSDSLNLASVQESATLKALRGEVRQFITEQRAAGAFVPSIDCWQIGWDEQFSRSIAQRGWIGMTVPTRYGGHGRSFQERFVVSEELLAAGAPLAAHWIADRQIAPALLKFGSPHLQELLLPGIVAGECYFGIGMSEPDSGSDLASVRTRANRVADGWRLNGTKVWTSGAQHCHYLVVLARTAPWDPAARHAGLSQFIVDLTAPGVTVRPIRSMDGLLHFNEVVLDDVQLAASMLLGEVGQGWRQVTSELSFERSGPERWLSTFALYRELLDRDREKAADQMIPGRLFARLAGLHQMSSSVAHALDARQDAEVAATVVKLLGTALEGDIVEFADLTSDALAGADDRADRFQEYLTAGLLRRPGFTLRGGTNEILRGVIARALGMR